MKLDRREVLKLAAGAALLRPGAGAGEALAAPAQGAGRFFDAREMALLDELTELILPADDHSPGARAANVASFIDAQLGEKDPSIPDWARERTEAKGHLAALDALSREMHGADLMAATGEQRVAVLTRAAAAEGDPKSPAEHAFVWLKGQTARGYYTSKIGLHDELNYQGNTLLVEFAGEDPR
jgi:gluconate 2-dehydrogenase subunit 3-like protein